ncbi:hypothetical protein ACLPJK_26760 [Pseudomonas aeruginosa]|uniref:hypothetical protein n=1 Tax=Pseudomonas aeruginosa TaxID=287 RepID=UPI003D27A9EF
MDVRALIIDEAASLPHDRFYRLNRNTLEPLVDHEVMAVPMRDLYFVIDYEGFGGCNMAVNLLLGAPAGTEIQRISSDRVGREIARLASISKTHGGYDDQDQAR